MEVSLIILLPIHGYAFRYLSLYFSGEDELSNIKVMFLMKIACRTSTPPWLSVTNPSFLLASSTSFAGSVTTTFLFRVKVT